MHDKKIIIIGAGLVGSLLALVLVKKGYAVCVYESRSDLRTNQISAGRSINLALSHRGLQILDKLGLKEKVLSHAIKMKSRIIHPLTGEISVQDYGTREGEYINSISRKVLNEILLNEIEKIQADAIHFDTKHTTSDLKNKKFYFTKKDGTQIIETNVRVFGTDGSSSATRDILLANSTQLRFNYQQSYQNYGYKELTLEPTANGDFQLENNGLHIWPRGHFMMIALPNPDASFTCTLFAPYHGSDGFDTLNNVDKLNNYFTKYFPDLANLFNNLNEQFVSNPIGNLVTVKCYPWHINDEVLLLGDAAHAIIPFYGQGMNCGFEDVMILSQLLDRENSWERIFSQFTAIRKPNTDAIADLAEDNFVEMRDKVADPIFQKKRFLEVALEKTHPNFYSKYSLVTFRPDISYYEAMRRGRRQDEILMEYCSQTEHPNIDEVYKKISLEGLLN